MTERDWSPFQLAPEGERGEQPRSIASIEGVEDRLRAAAFAEIQAREAFLWGADHFDEAPADLKNAWRELAAAEDRHLNSLLNRMRELGMDPAARKVSTFLWRSLVSCKTAKEFALYMASAEERGRQAGERFHAALEKRDPVTANIFGTIAREEVAHIELAARFFPGNAEQSAHPLLQ